MPAQKSGPAASAHLHVTDSRTGRQYSLPISRNSIQAVDLRRIVAAGDEHADPADLNSQGLRAVDEGFRNTAPVYTTISHLDPVRGTLQYRDHAIEDLWQRHGFEDCAHLLIWGHLPSPPQRRALASTFASCMEVPDTVARVIQGFPRGAPIMTIIMAGLSAWASLEPDLIPVVAAQDMYQDLPLVDKCIPRVMSALGVTVALAFCHNNGRTLVKPRAGWGYVENMLLMMGFAKDDGEPDATQVALLSSILLLHAEHGMCNATAAFLHCASTHADPISCLIAALVAIYGPMHGGSNIITYRQLERIGKVENIAPLIEDVKARKQRLFGFGHRIYRTVDPRATLLRDMIEDFRRQGKHVPLLDVAVELERQVSTTGFFVDRGIRANTDLYTVLAYQVMGLPDELVFPFICISRTQGFLAHWREFVEQQSPNWRPQQIFTGKTATRQRQEKL